MSKISLIICLIIVFLVWNKSTFSQSNFNNQNTTLANTQTGAPTTTITPGVQETAQTANKDVKPSQWATDFKEMGGLWAALASGVFLLLVVLLIIFKKEFNTIIKKLAASNISGVNLGKDGLGVNFANEPSPDVKEVADESDTKSKAQKKTALMEK